MLDLFSHFHLDQWIILGLVALMIGMTKTGISGLGLAVVPLLAYAFGARASTGVMLPLLLMADVYAVIYYHRMANWVHIKRLLPWAVTGILAGMFTGRLISDLQFRWVLSALVLIGISVMVLRDLSGQKLGVPRHPAFAALLGLLGGFASMVANAAGPVFAVYLLAMRLPKNEYIATGAWFFFIINLVKLPFHIWVWKTVHLQAFAMDLLVLPLILLGAWAGVKLVRLFSETFYRWLVIGMTLASAILLLLK